jgi:hypothetical protein
MKRLIALLAVSLTAIACGDPAPVAVDIKDVCAQPVGTYVTIQGFISLPKEMEIIRYTRGGQGAGITYKLFLMTKADATGDSVATVFSGTSQTAKNRIKMFPANYSWNDLEVYTDKDETVRAGKIVKITGPVEADEKTKCKVNANKIELP